MNILLQAINKITGYTLGEMWGREILRRARLHVMDITSEPFLGITFASADYHNRTYKSSVEQALSIKQRWSE